MEVIGAGRHGRATRPALAVLLLVLVLLSLMLLLSACPDGASNAASDGASAVRDGGPATADAAGRDGAGDDGRGRDGRADARDGSVGGGDGGDAAAADGASGRCRRDRDCDDGNGCNGVERCDTQTGACVPAAPWVCPSAPPECKQSGGVGAPSARQLRSVPVGSAAGLKLRDEQRDAANAAVIARVEAHASTKAVTLASVLSNLNRAGVTGGAAPVAACVRSWFRFNAGDEAVTYWYPQGTTGSGTGVPGSGLVAGRRVLLVSWYHKPDNDPSGSVNKGVRLSIIDATNPTAPRYRHVLLVEPVAPASYKPVRIHAGGIAWYRGWLYVADTSRGFRVFDVNRLIEVKTGDKQAIGLVAAKGEYHAFGYRYVMPQVNRYSRCAASCCARFSFVSVDLSGAAAALVSGEYSAGNMLGRLMRWPLDAASGKLVTVGGAVSASAAFYPGLGNMQGAAFDGARVWVTKSGAAVVSGYRATLYSGVLGGALKAYGFAYGPEDLHAAPGTADLWSTTEHPSSRYVLSVDRARLAAGCK